MWPFKPKETTYLAVESSESSSELEFGKTRKLQKQNISLYTYLLTAFFAGALCLILGFVGGQFIQDNGLVSKLRTNSQIQPTSCRSITTRKEWRSLSTAEKEDYVTAVQCLTTKQSKLSIEKGDTLYNDFPYLHTTIGGYCECQEEEIYSKMCSFY